MPQQVQSAGQSTGQSIGQTATVQPQHYRKIFIGVGILVVVAILVWVIIMIMNKGKCKTSLDCATGQACIDGECKEFGQT